MQFGVLLCKTQTSSRTISEFLSCTARCVTLRQNRCRRQAFRNGSIRRFFALNKVKQIRKGGRKSYFSSFRFRFSAFSVNSNQTRQLYSNTRKPYIAKLPGVIIESQLAQSNLNCPKLIRWTMFQQVMCLSFGILY